ncbi:hypothetical protein, partial [Cellulomonas fimi]
MRWSHIGAGATAASSAWTTLASAGPTSAGSRSGAWSSATPATAAAASALYAAKAAGRDRFELAAWDTPSDAGSDVPPVHLREAR